MGGGGGGLKELVVYEHCGLFVLCRPPLNPQLEDLILRMLTKDPNERITIQQIKVCKIFKSRQDA